MMSGSFAVSAGASGAIFGIVGALLYVAIRNRGRIGDVSGRGLAFMVILSLYYGFTRGYSLRSRSETVTLYSLRSRSETVMLQSQI